MLERLQGLGDDSKKEDGEEGGKDEFDDEEGGECEFVAETGEEDVGRMSFDIDLTIDLKSKALIDMISEAPSTVEFDEVAPASAEAPASLGSKLSAAEAFENW